MEIFCCCFYFSAVYNLPAGIFDGIKDMARKQEDTCTRTCTHTNTYTHSLVFQNPMSQMAFTDGLLCVV